MPVCVSKLVFADPNIALKGSDHLDFILDNRLYRPVSPPHIEELYEQVAPDAPDFTFVTQGQVLDGSAPPERIILPADSHNLVAKVTGVPELSGEIERAIWQIQRQFQKENSGRSSSQPERDAAQSEKRKRKQAAQKGNNRKKKS